MGVQIAVFGNVSLDTLEVPLEFNSETLDFDTRIIEDMPGGGAYYTALTYAKMLGQNKVGLISAVGEGYENSQGYKELKKAGVNLDHLKIIPGEPTTKFRITSEYYDYMPGVSMNQIYFNANHFPEEWTDVPLAHIAPISTRIQAGVLAKLSENTKVALDTHDQEINTPEKTQELLEILKLVDFFFPNHIEIGTLYINSHGVPETESPFPWHFLKELNSRYTVIKREAGGCFVYDKTGGLYSSPSVPIPIWQKIEQTGAGSVFAAGFMSEIMENGTEITKDTIQRAIAVGTSAASFVISQPSATALFYLNRDFVKHRAQNWVDFKFVTAP